MVSFINSFFKLKFFSSAVLEVSNVTRKYNKTVIQARTSDQKYLAISHVNLIDINLMPGDIAFFMDTTVGRYKDVLNQFTYDWDLKEHSKVRLLMRGGEINNKDVFPGAPIITKNTNITPNTQKKDPTPKQKSNTQPKTSYGNTKQTDPSNNQKKTGKDKSVISVNIGKKPKNPPINGYLVDEFKMTKYAENNKEVELFIGEVQKVEGGFIQVAVNKTVQLPILLRKGHLLQIGGKDIELNGKPTRLVEHDTQLIFKALGLVEGKKDPPPKSLLASLSLNDKRPVRPPAPIPPPRLSPVSLPGHLPPTYMPPQYPPSAYNVPGSSLVEPRFSSSRQPPTKDWGI